LCATRIVMCNSFVHKAKLFALFIHNNALEVNIQKNKVTYIIHVAKDTGCRYNAVCKYRFDLSVPSRTQP
jgi:hypothetical protein